MLPINSHNQMQLEDFEENEDLFDDMALIKRVNQFEGHEIKEIQLDIDPYFANEEEQERLEKLNKMVKEKRQLQEVNFPRRGRGRPKKTFSGTHSYSAKKSVSTFEIEASQLYNQKSYNESQMGDQTSSVLYGKGLLSPQHTEEREKKAKKSRSRDEEKRAFANSSVEKAITFKISPSSLNGMKASPLGNQQQRIPKDLKVIKILGRPRGRPRKHVAKDKSAASSESSFSYGKASLTQKMLPERGHVDHLIRYEKDLQASVKKDMPKQEFKRRGRPRKNPENQSARTTVGKDSNTQEGKKKMENRPEALIGDLDDTKSTELPISSKINGALEKRRPGRPKKVQKITQDNLQNLVPKINQPKPSISQPQPNMNQLHPNIASVKRKSGGPRKSDRLSSGNETVSDKDLSFFSEDQSDQLELYSPERNGIKTEEIKHDDNTHGMKKPIFIIMQNSVYGNGEINIGNLKVASWSLHGIPAGANIKFVKEYILSSDADVLCVQGFKLRKREFIDGRIAQKFEGKYYFYLSCNKQTGFGDLILTKLRPISIKEGMKDEKHRAKGSIITLEFQNLYIVSVNAPSVVEKNLNYRIREWNVNFNKYMMKLSYKKKLIILGNMKVPHTALDSVDPEGLKSKPGHSAEEKQSFSKLLENGLIDTFRYFYPKQKKWTQIDTPEEMIRADYALVSESLLPSVTDSLILDHIQTGYHCPIELHLKF